MSWMSSFGPIETRNRPPTPDFPVSPSDFADSPASNTTPRQHKIQRHDSAKMLRGRPSTPDRSSPLQSPVMSHPHNMQTIPPSPRSARRVKVLPDSPQPVRNRPPTPDESVMQDLSWLQHYVVWKERQDNYKEQPIFTTKAHVFMIDPETKKNWIPASKSSVSVSYYYDSTRNTYRIISVDGSKAIVNSIITPGMTFTKTSQKFGQWSDPKANTVYGLGFGTEGDLAKFIEKFKEVKDLTRQQAAQNAVNAQVNGNAGSDERDSAVQSPTQQHTSRHFLHTRSSSLSSMQGQEMRDNVNIRERRNSFNSPTQNGGSPDGQLKYENDRLKLALAQSSANAKKWEIELQTLKNNNSRLTSALQESTANVEEWKKQLAAYKEDSTRMKKKIAEMERQQTSPDQVLALQGELQQLTERLERVQLENQDKQDEINQLNQQVREYSEKQNTNTNLESRVQNLEEENEKLKLKNTDLQRLLDESRMQYDQETSELLHLQDTLGSKVTELYEIHEQIVSTIRKESQS